MLILSLYDAITGYSVKDEPYMIDAGKIIYNIIALIQNLFIAYVYFFNTTTPMVNMVIRLVFTIALIDWFFITHPEIYYHHILVYAVCIYFTFVKIDLDKMKSSVRAFLGIEISTIFLSIRELIKITGFGTAYGNFVNIIFGLVFVYMRIYLFGKHFFTHMGKIWNYSLFGFLCCISIFAVNVYWAKKIVYKGYKEILCT